MHQKSQRQRRLVLKNSKRTAQPFLRTSLMLTLVISPSMTAGARSERHAVVSACTSSAHHAPPPRGARAAHQRARRAQLRSVRSARGASRSPRAHNLSVTRDVARTRTRSREVGGRLPDLRGARGVDHLRGA